MHRRYFHAMPAACSGYLRGVQMLIAWTAPVLLRSGLVAQPGIVRLGFGTTLSGTGSEAGEGQGFFRATVRLAETSAKHPGQASDSCL